MKVHNSSKPDSEIEALGFGAGAMSETAQISRPEPKRKTIFIKLYPKPNAPRSSSVVIRYLKKGRSEN
jgi:hypothetical protein